MNLDAGRPEDEVLANIADEADLGQRLGDPAPRRAPPSRPPLPTAKSPSQTKKQIPRVS
jgi:hypothetical protein